MNDLEWVRQWLRFIAAKAAAELERKQLEALSRR